MSLRPLLRSQRGFSLVELIVAIAILVLITTAFLGMYYTGVFGITSAGIRSSNIHLSKEELENKIFEGTTEQIDLSIELLDGTTITVLGEVVEFPNENVVLRTFIPYK